MAADADLRAVYEQSLLVLAASEDKIYRGASIASPSMPWIWGTLKLEADQRSGPYHLVWPRDLYHVATAQKAAGDDAAAKRLLDYLWRVQKPDGTGGRTRSSTAARSGRPSSSTRSRSRSCSHGGWAARTRPTGRTSSGPPTTSSTTRTGRAAIRSAGRTRTATRPNTIATEIAGLICAADIARSNGEPSKAAAYEALADYWQRRVESWTATTNGPYSPRPYYLRVTKDGMPDNPTTYNLGDNFDRPVDQREIVDNSFLGLVLFGVKPWNDPTVLNSLIVGDRTSAYPLAVATPSGTAWHRFTFDGYGEQPDGGDWDLFFDNPVGQTRGRLWPLLSGERGEYELLAGGEPRRHLRTIANTANDGLMLPEQIWDDMPPPGERSGRGTRSATPLAWTHAQFLRLAWSIQAGRPIERPSVVSCRYTGVNCP